MKILVLSHVSDYVGGAERSILQVLDVWKKEHDIELEFILRKPLGSYVKELDKRNIKYYAVDYTYWSDSNPPRDVYRKYNTARRNSRAVLQIEKIIQESQPDIVATNSIVAPWAAFAAHYQQVPHVWFVREYGDLDHGREFEIGREKTFQDIGNLSNIVIANSQTLASHVKQFVDPNKVTALYTPFDIGELHKQSKIKVKNPFTTKESLRLVMTGNLAPSKGHLDAIKAVGEVNAKGYSVELGIIGRLGQDDFMKTLHAAIDEYDIKDKVHFLGYQSNPLSIVAKADAGIMASRQEAFGRVTFEYIAMGKPVIGSKSGATPEIIDDAVCGYLYMPGDTKDLAGKIEAYAKDRGLIDSHSKAALKKAEKMMTSEYSAAITYEKVVASLNLPLLTPLNFTHRWLEYPEMAAKYMDMSNKYSLRTLLRLRLRAQVKPYYVFVRDTYARITGR